MEIEIGQNGKLPNEIMQLTENEKKAILFAPPPFKITQVRNTGLKNLSDTKPYCFKITQENGHKFLHILEIKSTILYYHCVLEVVLRWSKERYTIGPRASADNIQNNNTIKGGRIMIDKYSIGVPIIGDLAYYDSLEELKASSNIYKQLTVEEKQWVTNKDHFNVVKDIIYTIKFQNWNSTAKFIKHMYLGSIKKGKYSGVHHIYSVLRGNAMIKKIVDMPNKNGVWRAILELRDPRFSKNPDIKEWKSKDEITTFFPNEWDHITLLNECIFAFENKNITEDKKHSKVWSSITKSGIYVEIITNKNGDILTMYPDWHYESAV